MITRWALRCYGMKEQHHGMQSTEMGGFVLVSSWQLAFLFWSFVSLASPHACSTTRAFAIMMKIGWSEWLTRAGMVNKESWSWVKSGWGTSELFWNENELLEPNNQNPNCDQHTLPAPGSPSPLRLCCAERSFSSFSVLLFSLDGLRAELTVISPCTQHKGHFVWKAQHFGGENSPFYGAEPLNESLHEKQTGGDLYRLCCILGVWSQWSTCWYLIHCVYF